MESRMIARDGEERTTTRPTPAGAPSCAPAQGSRFFFDHNGACVDGLTSAETQWLLVDAAAWAEEAATLLRIDAMLDDAAGRASDRLIESMPHAARCPLTACRLLVRAGRRPAPRADMEAANDVSLYALI